MRENNYIVGQRIIKIDCFFWIVSSTTNAVWKCDSSFNVIDFEVFQEERMIEDLFRAIVCVNDCIYCFPYNAKYAYKIDTKMGKAQKLNIENMWDGTKERKFSYAFVYENMIIAIGRGIEGVMKYDLDKDKAFLIDEGWLLENEYICSFSHAVKQEKAYTVSVQDSLLMEIDLKKNTIVRHYLSDYCDSNLTGIMLYNDFVYVVNDQNEVLKIDDNMKVLEKKKINSLDSTLIRYAEKNSEGAYYVDNKNGCLIIEKGNGEYKKIFDVDNEYGYCFSAVELYEKKLLLQSRTVGNIYFYSYDDEKIELVIPNMKEDIWNRYSQDIIALMADNSEVLIEDSNLGLYDFLGALKGDRK